MGFFWKIIIIWKDWNFLECFNDPQRTQFMWLTEKQLSSGENKVLHLILEWFFVKLATLEPRCKILKKEKHLFIYFLCSTFLALSVERFPKNVFFALPKGGGFAIT